ncbi:hypothetical protein CAPTEDRAFT_228908 [Capitella teleta]|uniref:3'-5' exonuclease domain-containing protein n=1 Tax=Capitella teleta TaxID=283909 RepID=R7TL48_CAPTE|nr:hypothetical protein CAPTEDRAFT_228908 [Capitella teleta]|eukprot:ELT94573.1 hypothetical protein CAPTEDRAFT_228908 [Capitella teleta]
MEWKLVKFGATCLIAVAAGVSYYIFWLKKNEEDERKPSSSTLTRSPFKIWTPYSAQEILPKQDSIFIINNSRDWDNIVEKFLSDVREYPVLGLDCEWCQKSSFGVALLQIATHSGLCLLIRLYKMQADIPRGLVELLADKKILKVGVAITSDADKLFNSFDLCTLGCVELCNLADRSRIRMDEGRSLAALAEQTVGLRIDKGVVRSGNWEADVLSEAQVMYAATDALIAVRIFTRLVEVKLAMNRENKWQSRCSMTKGEYWTIVQSMCQGIVDRKELKRKSACAWSKEASPQKGKKNHKELKPRRSGEDVFLTKSKPQYENCEMLAPDGQLLCTCSTKKAEWYVEKGLAERVGDEPLTIRLIFEPSGRPVTEDNYYTQKKDNICVVCGKSESLVRKNIVPHQYRKYFPAVMKDHRCHDLLLMCTSCHLTCDVHDTRLKKEFALRCNAPMDNDAEGSAKFRNDDVLIKLRSAARALLLNGEKIPAERRKELEQMVTSFYGLESISTEALKMAIEINPRLFNEGYIPHGKKVVDHMMENEGLVAFERTWRQNFLRVMQPKFMPSLWSVDHSHQELSDLGGNLLLSE